jgi:CHASE3 domain sensor protein
MSPLLTNPSSSVSKFALRLAAVAVLALIVINSVVSLRNLQQVRQSEAHAQQASVLQANVRAILLDLSEIEAAQRGYILTNQSDYLKPYDEARSRLSDDFGTLRTRLASGTDVERAQEAKLESLAQAKLAEVEKSIELRRRSFRKRAFDVIDTNEGKGYMDEARTTVAELSAASAKALSEHQRATNESIGKAQNRAVMANLLLLALTALVFVAFHFYTRVLENAVRERTAALRDVNVRLEGFTSTISQRVRDLLTGLQESASALLHGYGDFLPRQAQQYAEHIQGAAGETNQLLEELVEDSNYERVA